jgi:hypothetical protein
MSLPEINQHCKECRQYDIKQTPGKGLARTHDAPAPVNHEQVEQKQAQREQIEEDPGIKQSQS